MICTRVPGTSGGVGPRRVDHRDPSGGSLLQSFFCPAVGCFLVLGLVAGQLFAADDPVSGQSEPPVRLQKKVRPQPQPAPSQSAKPAPKETPKKTQPPPEAEEPKEEPEPSVEELEEKIREITNRIAKNMTQAEKGLQKNDAGEATQQTQRDIVHDLDELIEQTRRQQQQPPSGSSSAASSNPRRRQSQTGARRPSPAPAQQALNQSGNNARGGKASSERTSKIADLYKDVWGHLPETLRQEMDQYSREQFMAKYGDLLKQYYATIAEKGRRKAQP